MTSEIILILDRAFENSLWAFLGCFLILLVFSRFRLRARQKRVEDLFDRDPEEPAPKFHRLPVNEWRLAVRTLLVALLCGGAFFLVFVFTPLPFFQNFASGDSWRITPLRLTAVTYDRYYEGFTLDGEVWNQTETPFLQLQGIIRIWGTDDKLLDEVPVEIDPSVLPGGSAGTFNLRYEKNSPFIKGYQVTFVDQGGQPVPHVTGFNVE